MWVEVRNPKARLQHWKEKGILVAVVHKSGVISLPKYVLEQVKPPTLRWRCYLDLENRKVGIQFSEKGDRKAYKKNQAVTLSVKAIARIVPGPGLYPLSTDINGFLVLDLARPLELLTP